MKKVITLITLALFLCGTMVSFAAGIDDEALMTILDKANGHPDKDEYTEMLREQFQDSDGIEALKGIISIGLTKADREKLARNGIEVKDVFASLDGLKKWDLSERMDLVKHVEDDEMDKARELIIRKGGVLAGSDDPAGSGGGAGGGSGVIDSEKDDNDSDKDNEAIEDETDVDKPDLTDPDEPGVTNFKDIKGHWAQKNIEKMAQMKIVAGMSEDTFGPENSVTRSQMVAFISRLLDLEEAVDQGEMPFTDIKKGDWDYNVVKIAYGAKIVSGTSATTFEPNKPVTREQMVAMIVSGLKYKNVDLTVDEHKDLKAYADYNGISNWALNAVQQGVDLNLIAGKTPTTLDAQGTASRAEAVTVLERVSKLLK